MSSPRVMSLWRLWTVAVVMSLASGVARAGADPDVDLAIAQVSKLDRITEKEFNVYKSALDKYADRKQALLNSLGALLEADEDEVDGKWDQICDGGLSALSEVVKEAPAEKTQLKEFFETEKGVWEILKKVELPQAEEAETRVRKMVQTIHPALEKSIQEMIEEDRRADEETAKTWATVHETSRNVLRIILQFAVDSKELGDMLDDWLKNPEGMKAAVLVAKGEAAKKNGRLKNFAARVALAFELNRKVITADEESMKAWERAKASLANVQHSKAVTAHAGRWTKVVEAHLLQTRDTMVKYEQVVKGKLVGSIDNDTKAQLSDVEFYKKQIEQLEADSKSIEDGLNQLERRINEYRDGEFKTKLKDVLSKCRSITKEVSDIRSTLKSEYESALGDSGLK